MQAVHIHDLNGEIDSHYGLYWFFYAVKDCVGYGEPVTKHVKPKEKGEQMELFERSENARSANGLFGTHHRNTGVSALRLSRRLPVGMLLCG
jgi:hypothetical protein